MQGHYIEAVGLAAGCLTTAAFVPQVIKTWRLRSARDVSLGMYLMFMSGVSLWLAYGLFIGSLAVVAANVVTWLLAACVLVMKLSFDPALKSGPRPDRAR
jgi:MtN3 and saliva related transmembrane protein